MSLNTIAELKEENEELKAELKILTDKFAPDYPCAIFNDKATEAYEKLKKKLEHKEDKIEDHLASCNFYEEKCQELKAENEKLKAASFFNAKASEEFAKLNEEVVKLTGEVKKLKKENGLLECRLEQPEGDEREYLTLKMIAETKKAMKLQEENEKFKEEVEKLTAEVKKLTNPSWVLDHHPALSGMVVMDEDDYDAEERETTRLGEIERCVWTTFWGEDRVLDDTKIYRLEMDFEKILAERKELAAIKRVLATDLAS